MARSSKARNYRFILLRVGEAKMGEEKASRMSDKKRKCGLCLYWEMDPEYGKRGECRFNPPSINEPFTKEWMWPFTYNDKWCGRFEARKVEREFRQKGPI